MGCKASKADAAASKTLGFGKTHGKSNTEVKEPTKASDENAANDDTVNPADSRDPKLKEDSKHETNEELAKAGQEVSTDAGDLEARATTETDTQKTKLEGEENTIHPTKDEPARPGEGLLKEVDSLEVPTTTANDQKAMISGLAQETKLEGAENATRETEDERAKAGQEVSKEVGNLDVRTTTEIDQRPSDSALTHEAKFQGEESKDELADTSTVRPIGWWCCSPRN
jgi:hypothetical protein